MSESLWSVVDDYFGAGLAVSDPALDAALKASAEAGLPDIGVSPSQGRMLQIIARLGGARAILEVGTLGGYSTIWLARALPADGRLITLEIDPEHARVAWDNVANAGVGDLVDVRVGPAVDTLRTLAAEGAGPFDLTFIDADKANNPEYFARALEMSRPGGVIIVDNVVRQGAVADESNTSAAVVGVRRLVELVAKEPRVTATAIQTVGLKGHDGFMLALVNDER